MIILLFWINYEVGNIFYKSKNGLFNIFKIKDIKDILEGGNREIKSNEIVVWFKGNFRRDILLFYVW